MDTILILAFFWDYDQGYDLHVVRNGNPSQPLSDAIVLWLKQVDPAGNTVTQVVVPLTGFNGLAPAVIALVDDFTSIEFKPVGNFVYNAVSNSYENFGISVHAQTGVVTADVYVWSELNNFIVNCTLTRPSGDNTVLPIRIHVHDNIVASWLTPNSLHIDPDFILGYTNFTFGNNGAHDIDKLEVNYEGEWITWWDVVTDGPGVAISPGNDFSLNAGFIQYTTGGVFREVILLKLTTIVGVEEIAVPCLFKSQIALGNLFGSLEVRDFAIKGLYRLSAYAEFGDGTVGDITRQHGLVWTSSSADIQIDAKGFMIADAAAAGATITATLQPNLADVGVTTATGTIVVRPSWKDQVFPASRVPWGPGADMADVPNVLFLSDGFATEADFKKMVRKIVRRIRFSGIVTPWDQFFRKSINLWTCFVETPEASASILNEVALSSDYTIADLTTGTIGLNLDSYVPEATATMASYVGPGELTLQELIDLVGYPVVADYLGSTNNPAYVANAQARLTTRIADWQLHFDAAITDAPGGAKVVTFDLFERWCEISKRRLLNERDSFFGLTSGSKPRADWNRSSRLLSFHPNRQGRLELTALLNNIVDAKTGDRIGQYWGMDAGGNPGKDFRLLVILSAGTNGFGTNHHEDLVRTGNTGMGMILGLEKHSTFNSSYCEVVAAGVPAGSDISPFPIPEKLQESTVIGTLVHELSHSFNLLDEYAVTGKGGLPDADYLEYENKAYNVQPLLTNNPWQAISGNDIPWRWPRIQHAGVLAAAPVAAGEADHWDLQLEHKHARQFSKDDIVHIRTRNLSILHLYNLVVCDALKVTAISGDIVTVTLQPGSVDHGIEFFTPGALLYCPVPADTDVNNNPLGDTYAEIMSPIIRDYINTNLTAMTVMPCAEDYDDVQMPVNLPAGLIVPVNTPSIIGYYAGGAEFTCGIYHPSGSCIMRAHATSEFCHVCRYALADQIDPRVHKKLDKKYAKIYPRKV